MTFHYTSVLLALRICAPQSRAVNGPHFEARNGPKPEIASRNLARARHLFLKPNLGPKPNFPSELRYVQLRGNKKRSVRV